MVLDALLSSVVRDCGSQQLRTRRLHPLSPGDWREKFQPQSYDFRRLSTQWNRTCRQQNNVAKFCYLRDVVTTLITNHYG